MEIFFFLIIALLVGLILSGLYTVRNKQAAVIERFGKFVRIANPGLNLKIPLIEKVVGRPNLKVMELPVNVETKTSDNVFVRMIVSVQYQITPGMENIRRAFYELDNPRAQIESYVFDSVRSEVPKLQLDEVFEEKDKIAGSIKQELTETMHLYGYSIVKALVTDIDPDERVKIAMNEINANKRLKEAAIEKAAAQKITVVAEAEAQAESKKLQGEGIANQRKAIANGLKDSAEDLKTAIPGADAKTVMNLLMITQYFDTLQEMAKTGVNTVFMPSNPGAINDYNQELMSALIGADLQKQSKDTHLQ